MGFDKNRAREVCDGTTARPWRYGALEFGGRALVDAHGYFFAQVDDDGNGRFCAEASTLLPAAIARIDALEAALREALEIGQRHTRALRAIMPKADRIVEDDNRLTTLTAVLDDKEQQA